MIGQDDVAVALEQRPLLGERLQKADVVQGDGSKCRRQRSLLHRNENLIPLNA